ncbi:MAG: S8 family serine peptidase, partial [Thermoleophilia bacterium]|nr:S8 family serine peptidase [Thermoleophilia bacterium]
IDVAAPGDNVLSSLPGGKYGKMSGTSMAAPGYAAVAAIVKSAYPNLTMKQVEQRIFRSVQTDGSAAGWNGVVASGGRVEAAAAVMPIATPTAPGVVAGQQVVAGAPVKLGWGTDITDGQSFKVQVSTNPTAVSAVHETFAGAAPFRAFVTDGDAQWKITAGAGVDKSAAFAAPQLSGDKQSRLSLTETLPEAGEVSFRYHAGAGELSFFVDRELQAQPATSSEWKEFRTTLPAGEHTLTWLSTGRTGGSGETPALDELKIASVRDARWTDVGTTKPGETSIAWTPERPAASVSVRVQPNNGRWSGDLTEGAPFSVTSK